MAEVLVRLRRLGILALLAVASLQLPSAEAGQVDLVSRRHPSFVVSEAPGLSGQPAVSADGRWTVFSSTAPNLLPQQSEANTFGDVFLKDRLSGTLSLVSHAVGFPATTGVSFSAYPSISADGRYVAFLSSATNLVPGQTGSTSLIQVFLYDRIADSMTLVSHAAGSPAAGANNSSSEPVVSKDGGYVVFTSTATNLVPGQSDTAGTADVFLYDRAAGTLTLVSHASSGAATAVGGSSPEVSADGRYVLFDSSAANLFAGQIDANNQSDVFLYDRTGGTSTLASHAAALATLAGNAFSQRLGLSDDGAWILFRSQATDLAADQFDTSGSYDAFLLERSTGTVTLLSHLPGVPGFALGSDSGQISADGSWIALSSLAGNLVSGQTDANGAADLFLVERATGTMTLVSRQSGTATTVANGASGNPRLSADGRYLLFTSAATDLVAGQSDTNAASDVFLFDRIAGTTVLASHADGSSLSAGNGNSWEVALSADGAVAAYSSTATDLTADTDTYDRNDVFLFQRSAGTNEAISLSDPVTRLTPDGDNFAAVNRDGRFVLLTSYSKEIAEGQIEANVSSDVFLLDRLEGTAAVVSHADGYPMRTANQASFASLDRAISQDGNWAVFHSDATDLVPDIGPPPISGPRSNIFLYGRGSGSLTLVSRSAADPTQRADGPSFAETLSGDGRYVAFVSRGSDLVDGQIDAPPIPNEDVFLYDRITGGMTLVSHAASDPLEAVGAAFNQFVGISLDGRWVAFASTAPNLVPGQIEGGGFFDLFLFDRVSGATTLVTRAAGTATTTANGDARLPRPPALSADGRWFAFLSSGTNLVPGQVDTNGVDDLFVFDRATGTVTLVTRKNGTTATTGNGEALFPRISEDGSAVIFSSKATDLVPGQIDLNQGYDAFVYNVATGTLSLLTPDGTSTDPTGLSFAVAVSPRGRFVAFSSMDTLRIPGQNDQNGNREDLFVLDRLTGSTRLASRALASPLTTGNNAISAWGTFAADASQLFFQSNAADHVPGDYNGKLDVFVQSSAFTAATDFHSVTACRAVDTRSGAPLTSGQTVLYELHGLCGIPETARAVAVNVTVVPGAGAGYVSLHPGDTEAPVASTVTFLASRVRSNNAILPLAWDGTGTLAATPLVGGNGAVHLVLDVSGWFE